MNLTCVVSAMGFQKSKKYYRTKHAQKQTLQILIDKKNYYISLIVQRNLDGTGTTTKFANL